MLASARASSAHRRRLHVFAGVVSLLVLPALTAQTGDPTNIEVIISAPVCGDGIDASAEVCDPAAVNACGVGMICSTVCSCIPEPDQGDISLQPGLNLVSVPIESDDTLLPQLLASIEGNYKALFAYDSQDPDGPWQSYDPNRPGLLNTLGEIETHRGFWIDMLTADTLETSGTADPSVIYDLAQGWNLVSYPSLSTTSVTAAFQNVSSSINSVHAYDASTTTWTYWAPGDGGSTLSSLEPGRGYWVLASQAEQWRWDGTDYEPRLAELAPVFVAPIPNNPEILQGGPGTVQVELIAFVRNEGERDAQNVDVELADTVNAVTTVLATLTFLDIPAFGVVDSSSFPPQFRLFNLGPGAHELSLVVDPSNAIPEENEGNNAGLYLLNVQDELKATINQNPTSGIVPLDIVFTPTVTGGLPPYSYLWLTGTRVVETQNPTLPFSTSGANTMELFVTDSRGELDAELVNFNLTANASPSADYSLTMATITTPTATAGLIPLTIGSTGGATPAVRVQVSVYDSADPTLYNEVIYDAIVSIPISGTDSFDVPTPDLPLGTYTAQANINPDGALPESPNVLLNGDAGSFTIHTASGQAPLIVGTLEIMPDDPFINTYVEVDLTLTNNDPSTRIFKVTYLYVDVGGQDQFAGEKTVPVKAGETLTFRKRWLTPLLSSTTLKIELQDAVAPTTVLGTASLAVPLRVLDYGISNLVLSPDINDGTPPDIPKTTNATPHVFSFDVTNNNPVAGYVNYRVKLGTTEVFAASLTQIPPYATEHVRYSYIPAPAQFASTTIEVYSFHDAQPYASLFESDPFNNSVFALFRVFEGNECLLSNIEIGPPRGINDPPKSYELWQEIPITLTITNGNGQITGVFDFEILDKYKAWDTQQDVSTVITSSTETLGSVEVRDIEGVIWVPTQAGTHTIEISCGADTYTEEMFVQPHIGVSEQVEQHIESTVRAYVTPDIYDLDGEPLRILKLHSQADDTGFPDGEDNFAHGWVYRIVRVDDGTGDPDNEYRVNLGVHMGMAGIYDGSTDGVGEDWWRVWNTVGVTTAERNGIGGVRCSDGWGILPCDSTLIHRPTQSEALFDQIFGLFMLGGGLIAGETSGIDKVWDALELAVEAAELVTCDETFGRQNILPLSQLRMKNGTPYKVYQRLFIRTQAVGVVTGETEVYVDFANAHPHTCDNNGTKLPLRGIWINEIDTRATRANFEPGYEDFE